MINRIFSSKWSLVLVFICSLILMTSYETLKEFVFQGRLTSWQSHTITIIVTSLIATVSAAIMRSWVLSVYHQQKEIENKAQLLSSFDVVRSAVNHVMNNLLNYFHLVQMEVDDTGKVSKDTLRLLEESVEEARNQIKVLNQIQDPHNPESYKDIYPK